MTHSSPKLDCGRRGAAIAEMAIVIPVFLMIVFGIIEFGRGMMVNNMASSAAREGVRMAAQDGTTNADVTSAIQTFMNSALGLAPEKVGVIITTAPGPGNPDPLGVLANCQPQDLVTVQVEVAFGDVALIPDTYLHSTNLVGKSSMRHE